LASDPDGYFCAVEEGRIRGMVSALVRGRVWYLSMFFVLPGNQGRGLGRALLERALAYGEARGAEVRCTWATLDPRAQARYVMAGMAPRWPIYRLEGMPRRWRGSGRGSGSTRGSGSCRAIPAPRRR
jgi:GNAT superfamily N-acetyltransferase